MTNQVSVVLSLNTESKISWNKKEKAAFMLIFTLLSSPSLTRFSLKRLFRMEADMLPLASRMPASMASLLRSDSVNPLRNSSNCRGQRENQTSLLCVQVTRVGHL